MFPAPVPNQWVQRDLQRVWDKMTEEKYSFGSDQDVDAEVDQDPEYVYLSFFRNVCQTPESLPPSSLRMELWQANGNRELRYFVCNELRAKMNLAAEALKDGKNKSIRLMTDKIIMQCASLSKTMRIVLDTKPKQIY